MATTTFAYHYRRLHLGGDIGISISRGPVLVRRDDQQAWVCDYLLAHPSYTDPVTGRRGTQTVTIARPEPLATRLWLWPDRPLRLLQQFDAAGQATLYRIDFATLPHRRQWTIHQTDLYLDLFITADERDYALLDEDELALAFERGLISGELRANILAQAGEFMGMLEAGRFGSWLATYCDAAFELGPLTTKPLWTYRKYGPGEPNGWPAGVD
jgi:predicted RNA-binding protein associated with RNAse of E/G family